MKNLTKALIDFGANCPPIHKDQTAKGDKFSFDYVSLEAIVTITRPALIKAGLSYVQYVQENDLYTTLIHDESEEQIDSKIRIIYKENDPQSFGTGLSYARRQALCTMLNIAPEEKANTKVESKLPWLNPNDKSWNEVVTWLASSHDASIERVLKERFRISKANQKKLKEEAEKWSKTSAV